MTIASAPHESVGSKSLVAACTSPLRDLPRRRVQHSEVIGPRLGENNFAVLGDGQPVLTGVFPLRHRNLILLHESGAGIELSDNRTAIAGVPNVPVRISRYVVHANVEAR